MDRRPIGVFDSGLGGLTAVRQLRAQLPSENIIYFGDTSRVPYGNRSRDTILKYARQDMAFLRSFDPKIVVIACGTVSSNCLSVLQAEAGIPVIGVVEPVARRAASLTKNRKVGLIATRASVSSGAYEGAFRRIAPAAEVYSQACPLFVPLVEEGHFRVGDRLIELAAEEYLPALKAAGVDTLALGCTHYPLLAEVIGQVMGADVALVDAGAEAAKECQAVLEARDALADAGQDGFADYYTSDRAADFQRLASLFLGKDVMSQAWQIDITQY